MRIVFMGTPQIAADCLEYICQHHEVAAVFCQPDKPVGRKQILTPPPVKQLALSKGIPVYQPRGFKNGIATEQIRELAPDLIAVIAYGRILPQECLDIPRYGCINIHGSLLPKYRGSAPIQRSLMAGDIKTGLTAMKMNAGMDTGDIISVLPVELSEDDNADSVFARMGKLSGPFLDEVIGALENGSAVFTAQDNDQATYAPPIEKSEGTFSFDNSSSEIVNKVRGLSMWPNAVFVCGGKRVKVRSASCSELSGTPGEILSVDPLIIAASEGSVVLRQVVPEGSREMNGKEWAMGRRFRKGDQIRP